VCHGCGTHQRRETAPISRTSQMRLASKSVHDRCIAGRCAADLPGRRSTRSPLAKW
jgi:hypothetical protein